MRRVLIFTLILIWLTVVVAFYFIAHKPADSAAAQRIGCLGSRD